MIIKPKVRGFICTTAHPKGLEKNVKQQINYIKQNDKIEGAKNVLIIGSSSGYGLASRIALAFGARANTVGVYYDKEPKGKRTATPGWYNNYYFEKEALKEALYVKSFNADAFLIETKKEVIETIKKDLGKIDLIIYSVASPRRKDPIDGKVYTSSLKPVLENYKNKTVDFHTGEVSSVELEKATEDEVFQTIKVMGGEDWKMWLEYMKEAQVLAENFKTVAFSYIGPKITHPIYKDGAIGKAKEDLLRTSYEIRDKYKDLGARAYISVNKALVTQASSAIPIVPLYISILYKVMKEKKLHEGCIEQMHRLYAQNLYGNSINMDDKGRIRIDDLEMSSEVQKEISDIWEKIDSGNIEELSDLEGYRKEFLQLFGFGYDGLDYEKECEVMPK